MRNSITITIPGTPIAKKRPRFFRRGNHVGTYNCQETEEGRWLWSASQQIKEKIDGPIEMSLTFYMPIPASASKKKQAALLVSPHVNKPDIDNLQKMVLDCLNGVLFNDDRQIYKILAVKLYDFNPRTELIVRW